MIKVYVTGFNKPYIITGELVSEDQDYLILNENGVDKRIPQERIVLVEESSTTEERKPLPTEPLRPTAPTPILAKIPSQDNPTKEAIQKFINETKASKMQTPKVQVPVPPERASQIEPEQPKPDYDPNDTMQIEVNFNGAKKGRFDIEVPKGVMTGKYTPSLGREIFSHTEIKNVLTDGSAILDGIPVIKGNKVFYSTKTTASTEVSGMEKMQAVGQLMNAGSKVMNLASMGDAKPSNVSNISKPSFSMPASPFQQIPTLSVEEGDTE